MWEPKYEIQPYHGEYRTLFYVVDTEAPATEQPAIVATFHSRQEAEKFISD